jgi:succinate dehydrogenase/fumarate reductase flavoprotein subunit
MKHIQFRKESRYPGFYYRMDHNVVDEENWHCFVNSIYDKESKQWTCFKRASSSSEGREPWLRTTMTGNYGVSPSTT